MTADRLPFGHDVNRGLVRRLPGGGSHSWQAFRPGETDYVRCTTWRMALAYAMAKAVTQ